MSANISEFKTKAGAAARAAAAQFRQAPWFTVFKIVGGVVAVFVIAIVAFLAFADWNALRKPIGRLASGMLSRPIEIRGDLKVHLWSFAPTISVEGLAIGDPTWGKRNRVDWGGEKHFFAYIPKAETQIEFWPLLVGDIVLRKLELTQPDIHLARDDTGRANWSKDPSMAASKKPLQLPLIKRFMIADGNLELNDKKRSMLLQAKLNSREVLKSGTSKAFRLSGEGLLNQKRFNLELTGGALLNVNRSRPYRFNFDLTAADTHIVAAGLLQKPFDLGRYRADITATGDDLADLYHIIGLTLPNTPPYKLTTKLSREPKRYTLDNIGGRVGDSDLSGIIKVDTSRDRPFVDAKIDSKSLDFDDLLAVLGAPPSTKSGEAASPEQRAEAARLKAQGRILPDARLNLDRVRKMDAHLIFAAQGVVDAPLPLRSASIDLTINQGVLKIDPLTFGLSRGQLKGAVRIDARESVPAVNFDARISGAHIEDFIKTKNAVEGRMLARIKLQGKGATVRDAAGSANGSLSVVIPRGQVRKAFAELTGVNVVKGLGLLLSDDQSQADIRCGVASFKVSKGVAASDALVFDTEDVLIAGAGKISLKDETFDIKLQGHPKEVRLVRVAAPITVGGRWRSPKLGIDASKVLGQSGIALVASLLNPIAALLPFVDPGLADDADCKALLARAPISAAAKKS